MPPVIMPNRVSEVILGAKWWAVNLEGVLVGLKHLDTTILRVKLLGAGTVRTPRICGWWLVDLWWEQSAELMNTKMGVSELSCRAGCIKRSTIACYAAWPRNAPHLGREREPARPSGDCKGWKTSTPARWSQNGPGQRAQTALGCAPDWWSHVLRLDPSHRSWNGNVFFF